MTRLALPVEDFVLWAERLADLDWPISGEDFPQTISKFGWVPSDMQNQFVTGIGGQSDLASFHTQLSRRGKGCQVKFDGDSSW